MADSDLLDSIVEAIQTVQNDADYWRREATRIRKDLDYACELLITVYEHNKANPITGVSDKRNNTPHFNAKVAGFLMQNSTKGFLP